MIEPKICLDLEFRDIRYRLALDTKEPYCADQAFFMLANAVNFVLFHQVLSILMYLLPQRSMSYEVGKWFLGQLYSPHNTFQTVLPSASTILHSSFSNWTPCQSSSYMS